MPDISLANGHTNGHANGLANGRAASTSPVAPGVYAPLNTFFDLETEELDLAAFKRHALYIAQSGGELKEDMG